jgi:hypothetical protein
MTNVPRYLLKRVFRSVEQGILAEHVFYHLASPCVFKSCVIRPCSPRSFSLIPHSAPDSGRNGEYRLTLGLERRNEPRNTKNRPIRRMPSTRDEHSIAVFFLCHKFQVTMITSLLIECHCERRYSKLCQGIVLYKLNSKPSNRQWESYLA